MLHEIVPPEMKLETKVRYRHVAMLGVLALSLSSCSRFAPPSAGALQIAAPHGSAMPAFNKDIDLLYVSDSYDGIVDVYKDGSSRQVQAIHGFDNPTGMCVDRKGDVYVTDYYGDGVYEFAHGGSNPIRTLTTNGWGTGCSVNPLNGDVAIGIEDSTTNEDLADIQVFAKDSNTPTDYFQGKSGVSNCPYIQAPGYDDKGNLFFESEWGKGIWKMCALFKGASSITQVPFSSSTFSGADHAGSTMWDGKYITFEDYRNDISQNSVIYQAVYSTSGLRIVGSTTLGATCYYTNIFGPFIVGKKNTPQNHKQGTVVVGGNEGCHSLFGYWRYPAGGAPFKTKPGPPSVGGAVVSLAAN